MTIGSPQAEHAGRRFQRAAAAQRPRLLVGWRGDYRRRRSPCLRLAVGCWSWLVPSLRQQLTSPTTSRISSARLERYPRSTPDGYRAIWDPEVRPATWAQWPLPAASWWRPSLDAYCPVRAPR